MADIEWLGAHAQEVYNVVAHFQDHVGPDHALFGPATHFLTALDQEFDCAEFKGEPGLSLKAMPRRPDLDCSSPSAQVTVWGNSLFCTVLRDVCMGFA